MITFIVLIGFLATSIFIEIGIFPFMAGNITQPWQAKSFLAMAFAMTAVFSHLSRGKPIRINNPWVILTALYLIIQPFIIPKIAFPSDCDNAIYALRMYRPICEFFVYLLFFGVVSSIQFNRHEISNIASTFCFTAIIISAYCIIQYFHLDQFQSFNEKANLTSGGFITGTLAHPNQAGIILAAIIPFLIYQKRWIGFAIVCTAIIMTESLMAYGGAVIGIWTYAFYKGKNWMKISLVFIAIFVLVIGLSYIEDHPIQFNGRIEVWAAAWHLLTDGPAGSMIITGFGFGSFKHLMFGYLNIPFIRMHFELFQWLFTTGIIGLTLALFSLFWLIPRIFTHIIKIEKFAAFGISFIVLLACSFGSMPFQVEPHRYLAVFLFGFLHSVASKNKEGLR